MIQWAVGSAGDICGVDAMVLSSLVAYQYVQEALLSIGTQLTGTSEEKTAAVVDNQILGAISRASDVGKLPLSIRGYFVAPSA